MNKTLRRIAMLFLLVCTSVCLALTVAACNPEDAEKVTYSVTVSAPEGFSLADVKAQWLKGDEAVSDEIALNAEGKASVELEKGDYAVTLKGVSGGYTFRDATVTAENRDATISITAGTTTENTTVTVTVRMPAGFQTAFTGISAQAYKGDDEVGAARELSVNGSTQLTVPRDSQTYSVKLAGLPDYLGFPETTLTADRASASVTIQLAPAAIEYTVTFDTEEDLEGATVTFLKDGAAVEGATGLPVDENGQVKKSLVAGEYTAQLNLPADLVSNFGGAEVTEVTLTHTAEGRKATVTVTASEYTLTLDKPANITADYTAMNVILTQDGEDTDYSAHADAQGVATVRAPRGNYGVKVECTSVSNLKWLPVKLTSSVTAATVKLATLKATDASRVTINSEGRYYISVKMDPNEDYMGPGAFGLISLTLSFSVSEAKTYTAAWEYDKSEGDEMAVSNRGDGEESSDSLAFILRESKTSVNFELSYSTSDATGKVCGFILEVTSSAAPAQGTTSAYPLELQDGVNTVDASWKEAYYRVPVDYASHKITFGGDIEVSLDGDALENGAYIVSSVAWWSDKTLHVTSTTGNISFTLTKEDEPGATPAAAIEALFNTVYTHTFTGTDNWYYKFTPSEAGNYDFVGAGDTPDNFTSMSGITVYEGLSIDSDPVGHSYENKINLKQGTTYLLVLNASYGNTIGFKIIKSVAVAGDKELPIEITNVGETPTGVIPRGAGAKAYFSHTVTAESLNEENKLVFDFKFVGATGSSLQVYFYSDSAYESSIANNDFEYHVELDGQYVTVGRTVYFTISCYMYEIEDDDIDGKLDVYINKPVEKLTLKLDEPVNVIHEDSGGDSFSVVLDIDESVTPGEYVLQYNVNPMITTYDVITVKDATTSAVLGTAGGAGATPIPGSVKITLTEAIKKIKIEAGGASPDTYTWTFTLKEGLPVLKPGETLAPVDLTKSGVDIEAPAGRYKLTYTFNAGDGQFGITVGSYNATASANKETVVKIEIEGNTTITWQNHANVQGTVTFKLEAVVDPEITAATPLQTQFDKGDQELHIKLKDVDPAKFDFKIEVKDETEFSGEWTVEIGERVFTPTVQTGLVRTVAVEIPFDVEEIILKLNSKAAKDLSLELTLTKTGELDVAKLELNTPYDIWLAANRTFIEIPIDFATENGLYNISLNFSKASFARSYNWYAEVNSVKTAMGDSWGFQPIDVYIPANCKTLKIGVDSELSEAFKVTATVKMLNNAVFPDTAKGILVGNWGTEFKAYFDQSGVYKITISGDGITNVSIKDIDSAFGVDNDVIIKQGETEGKFTVKEAGIFTIKAIDMDFIGGMTVNVTIHREGDYVPTYDLTLNEQAEISWDEWPEVEKTINLTESGTYKVTLSGTNASDIKVETVFNHAVIINAGDLTGNFEIQDAQVVTLKFSDPTFSGNKQFNVKVEKV